MRMLDVFNLPVTKERQVCTLEDVSPIAIAASLLNKEYVFHAINSHDQLVDTIAEQEKVISELLDLLGRFYPYADYDEHDSWLLEEVNKAYELYNSGQATFVEHDKALNILEERKNKIRTKYKYKQSKGE